MHACCQCLPLVAAHAPAERCPAHAHCLLLLAGRLLLLTALSNTCHLASSDQVDARTRVQAAQPAGVPACVGSCVGCMNDYRFSEAVEEALTVPNGPHMTGSRLQELAALGFVEGVREPCV